MNQCVLKQQQIFINNSIKENTIINFINQWRLQAMMDRLSLGLELEQRILALCDTLDFVHNQRGRKIRFELNRLNALGVLKTGNESQARSGAAWMLLDLLERYDWVTEYSALQSRGAFKTSYIESSDRKLNLREVLESPYINRGRSDENLGEFTQPYIVFPFRIEIAHDEYKPRLSRNKFAWLSFNYSPQGPKNLLKFGHAIEDEIKSNDKNHYSIALSYRFLGQGLDKQRQMAEGTLREMLRLNDSEVTVTRVYGWIEKSSKDPNQADYAFWAKVSGVKYGFDIKILRDCMVILPLDYQSRIHQPMVKVLEAVHRAGNRLKTR